MRRAPSAVVVADEPYEVLGRLGVGETSDVFLARRARLPEQRVTLKVLRALGDEDLLRAEYETLGALTTSDAKGSAHFSQLVPQPVALGALDGAGLTRRPAGVYVFAPGFAHTLDDARAAYLAGVDPRAVSWIWRRLLELVGWAHEAGYAHAAVLPQHVVLHARDHGVRLVGWSLAATAGAPSRGAVSARTSFVPRGLGGTASRALDVAMSARCAAFALGGDGASAAVPSSVPRPLAELVARAADGVMDDAWALREAVGRAAEAAFGPPTYVPFALPSA